MMILLHLVLRLWIPIHILLGMINIKLKIKEINNHG
jgi:hypothetical protein